MHVAIQDNQQPDIKRIVRIVLLSCLVIVLPSTGWTLFGWLHLFFPLLSFFVCAQFGDYAGKRLLLTSASCSVLIYIAFGKIDLFVFSAVLLFAGYVLYKSAEKGDTVAVSGFKTFAFICFAWVLILVFTSMGSDASAYTQLNNTLVLAISEALEYYRQNESVSSETLLMLESTLYQMQAIVPLIMPAVLGSLAIIITWFSMVTGNALFTKTEMRPPWPEYARWLLPDKMIWLAIAMALMAFLPVKLLQLTGINILILLSIVYSFQGLAIAVFFMKKWRVPVLLRSFFYVMMVLQSFGTVVLLILGITDIWFDYRKIKGEPSTAS